MATKTKNDVGLQKIKLSTCAADVRAGAVAFGKAIAKDNRFHYGYGTHSHHNGCYFCNSGSNRPGGAKQQAGIKSYQYTFCCNPFVNACFAHGGGDPGALKLCKSGRSRDFGTSASTSYHKSKDWKLIKNPTISKLIPGDVMCGTGHIKIYIGGKKVVHAYHSDDNKVNSSSWNSSIGITSCNSIGGYRCYRYVGKGGAWMCLPSGSGVTIDADTTDVDVTYTDDGRPITLEKEVSRLYSSDNFEYIVKQQEDADATIRQRFTKDLYTSLSANLSNTIVTTGALPESALPNTSGLDLASEGFQHNKPEIMKSKSKASLLSFPTYVEAPTILLDFNGITIGGYGNNGDAFPNYISGMTVNKINGRINNYTINLTYQVRPGEDPNFIDKLIARTGYRNPMKIIYGDSMYDGGYFKDEEVIITDAKHNEDISAYRINYTISAISSVGVSQTAFHSFDSVVAKPSTEIYNLLYNSGEASNTLLSMFPGMQNRTLVSSYNMIPTTDTTVNLSGMTNVSPLSRLNYLTAAMSNESGSKSSYFLTYNDTRNNPLGGAYFKITEVNKTNTPSVNNSVYSLDIGYPSDNNITSFSLNTQDYWSLVYQNTGQLKTWEYGIDDTGQITAKEVNLLNKGSYEKDDLLTTKWWEEVTEYPISARVTIKGLLAPAMLMSYIDVNTYFYGLRDMASGLYVVTAQTDSIQGAGYTTELTLLRVSE